MKSIKLFFSLIVISAVLACTMAPRYKTPDAEIALEDKETKNAQITWDEYFKSQALQKIIAVALKNNRNLKIADLNIKTALESHNVVRANLLPAVNATGTYTRQGVPSAFAAFTPRSQFRANLSLTSYEVDFFGRLRSLKKAAYEDFLASVEARNVMQISLIGQVVDYYTQYLLDLEIYEITKANVDIAEERYEVSEVRYKNGIDLKTDLLNAKAIFETAKMNRDVYEKIVAQDKNALMLLIGSFDEKNIPVAKIEELEINENLLDLVASKSLLLRPDIKQAEHALKADNASIGAARAAFFPSISLTATDGYGSRELSDLFSSKTWSFSPQINLPIFTGGKNIAQLKLADLQKKVSVIQYQQAIENAFREASDELAQRKSIVKRKKSAEEIFAARAQNYKIVNGRRVEGLLGTVDVLDAEVLMLQSRQDLLNVRKEYLLNLTNLYKVLGGGSEVKNAVKK